MNLSAFEELRAAATSITTLANGILLGRTELITTEIFKLGEASKDLDARYGEKVDVVRSKLREELTRVVKGFVGEVDERDPSAAEIELSEWAQFYRLNEIVLQGDLRNMHAVATLVLRDLGEQLISDKSGVLSDPETAIRTACRAAGRTSKKTVFSGVTGNMTSSPSV